MAEIALHRIENSYANYLPSSWLYEIPINRRVYVYNPPSPLPDIETCIRRPEDETADLLKGLLA
ncbi:hypothetical protein [Dyella nitratireducens]|uniref:Uncharacterized protein n=1 Tax=Dyella nitratireducens TaxID=1849580 RepID=A0ABQ1FUA3_9GAMM|nr:hypothetical protein [Dyella nitratireducens]GGA29747.1 hypothetical protein GCM10010981_18380 [Dyella nitratireducens]GLQ43098.1 hypothetical protein GCM10007902_29480 [Dyella nitratireducens]